MRTIALLATAVLAITGCASLRIQDDDSFGKKAGKVTTRVLFAVSSMGMSELAIRVRGLEADIKQSGRIRDELFQAMVEAPGGRERNEAELRYFYHVEKHLELLQERDQLQESMTEAGRNMVEAQKAQALRDAALAHERAAQQRSLQPAPAAPAPYRPPTHCTSTVNESTYFPTTIDTTCR